MASRFSVLFVVLTLIAPSGLAQDGYFSSWFTRVDKTKNEQPHWMTPVATVTPRLEEEYRYDQFWQTNAEGVVTNNFDGGKGVELIPSEHVEVLLNLPPYIEHNSAKVKDGFGDASFLVKYRLLSANEEHGNYILTAFLGWSVPTGQYRNGALHAVITPTIAYGKGFGDFDLQGTFGVGLPDGGYGHRRAKLRMEQYIPVSRFSKVLAGSGTELHIFPGRKERRQETSIRDAGNGAGTLPLV